MTNQEKELASLREELEKAKRETAEAKAAGEEMAHLYSSACADFHAARAEVEQLTRAIADHITVRGEYLARAKKAEAEVERLSKRHACHPPLLNSDRVLNDDACAECAGVVERYAKLESALKRKDEALARILLWLADGEQFFQSARAHEERYRTTAGIVAVLRAREIINAALSASEDSAGEAKPKFTEGSSKNYLLGRKTKDGAVVCESCEKPNCPGPWSHVL